MKYELLIFDLDGTLIDSRESVVNCVKYVQKVMKLQEISYEAMLSHIGPPLEESYSKNFGLSGDALRQAIRYHKEYAVEKGFCEAPFYEGMEKLLSKLVHNYKVGIATLKLQETTNKIIETLNAMKYFDIIIGANVDMSKSKSDLIDEVIIRTSCSKIKTVMIGDSKYDAFGAEEVGIDFIGVTYGFGFKSQEEVYKFKSISCANSVEELSSTLLLL